MSLKEGQEYDLSRLVTLISSIDEVIAIILFGSIARGDYDEYSDYDLLVIFKDKESMWSRWDELFRRVGRLNLLIHLIPLSYEEFLKSEETFLEEIYKDGILLYAKYPFSIHLKPLHFRHKKLIIYSLRGLEQKEKVKLLYRLYGKRNLKKPGLLERLDGERLSEGCIIVPEENSRYILEILWKFGVKVHVLDVYA